jgi:hypothetical protein
MVNTIINRVEGPISPESQIEALFGKRVATRRCATEGQG